MLRNGEPSREQCSLSEEISHNLFIQQAPQRIDTGNIEYDHFDAIL